MSKPTDITVLRALLAVQTRLSSGDQKAFREMLTDLENGKIIRLSKAQRQWAEQKYYHLGLDRAFKDTPPPKIKVRKELVTKFAWEENRPIKPPGRT